MRPLLFTLCLAACAPAPLPPEAPPPTAAPPPQPSPPATAPAAPPREPARPEEAAPVLAPPAAEPPDDPPCAAPRPPADLCRCLHNHMARWGEGLSATCQRERSVGALRVMRVVSPDLHAGTQLFVVHEGADGVRVLSQLAHLTPGLGGVYRDLVITRAEAQQVGARQIVRFETRTREVEIAHGPGVISKRELHSEHIAVLCTTTPGKPRCLPHLLLRDGGIDEATMQPYAHDNDLDVGEHEVRLKTAAGDQRFTW